MARRRLTLEERFQKLSNDLDALLERQDEWFRERGIEPEDSYVHTKGRDKEEFLKWLIEQGCLYIGRDSSVVKTHLFACKFKPKAKRSEHEMWIDQESVRLDDGNAIDDDGYILQDLPDNCKRLYKITDLYEL